MFKNNNGESVDLYNIFKLFSCRLSRHPLPQLRLIDQLRRIIVRSVIVKQLPDISFRPSHCSTVVAASALSGKQKATSES